MQLRGQRRRDALAQTPQAVATHFHLRHGQEDDGEDHPIHLSDDMWSADADHRAPQRARFRRLGRELRWDPRRVRPVEGPGDDRGTIIPGPRRHCETNGRALDRGIRLHPVPVIARPEQRHADERDRAFERAIPPPFERIDEGASPVPDGSGDAYRRTGFDDQEPSRRASGAARTSASPWKYASSVRLPMAPAGPRSPLSRSTIVPISLVEMTRLETAHRQRPWRVHTLAHDFALEDLWSFDLGARRAGDVRAFLACFWEVMHGLSDSWLVDLRLRIGRAMKWDEHDLTRAIPGCAEASLSARLDADDRARNLAADDASSPLPTPKVNTVYVFPDEALYELSNDTIHALLHLAIPSDAEASLAVYVKHRGVMSHLYMAAIWPARHRILYPSLVAKVESTWRNQKEARER